MLYGSAVCHTWAALRSSEQYRGTHQGPTCSSVVGRSARAATFCLVLFPILPIHHHHHRVDEKPVEIVSVLASLFSHPPSQPVPVVTPHLLCPLSCLSRPRVARHETFLRASVGVLTVPGFPSLLPSSSTALCLFFATRPGDDDWPFLATRRQPSLPNPSASSLNHSSTATHHTPPSSFAAQVVGDFGPQTCCSVSHRALEPLPSLEAHTHAYSPLPLGTTSLTENLHRLGFDRSCHCTATRTRIIHILEDVAVRDNAPLGRTSVVTPRRLLRSSSY